MHWRACPQLGMPYIAFGMTAPMKLVEKVPEAIFRADLAVYLREKKREEMRCFWLRL